MITDEQLKIACDTYNKLSGINAAEPSYMRKALEAVEKIKPKPEPVGYVRADGKDPSELWQPDELSSNAKASGRWKPLYTTPPTREPLSKDKINDIARNLEDGYTLFDFTRLVEQAHGIGTSHELA